MLPHKGKSQMILRKFSRMVAEHDPFSDPYIEMSCTDPVSDPYLEMSCTDAVSDPYLEMSSTTITWAKKPLLSIIFFSTYLFTL